MREEIGLPMAEPPRRVFKLDACEETGWEFCWIYRGASEGPFTLHPEEIETGAWFAPEAMTHWVAENPDDFASAFVRVWEKLQAETRGNPTTKNAKDTKNLTTDEFG